MKTLRYVGRPISDIPDGSLILYRNSPYFISQGLEGRIATRTDGVWFFLKDLNWKTFRIIYEHK